MEGMALTAAKAGNMTKARGLVKAAKWAHGIQAIMRFIFPFVRTPVNILRMGLRKTPLGSTVVAWNILKGVHSMAKGHGFLKKYPGALMARHLTEQALAWAAFYLLYGMAEGDGDDYKKKWLLVGGRPFSRDSGSGDADQAKRLYGGTYMLVHRNESNVIDTRIPFGRIEPFATALGGMIDGMTQMKRHWRNRKDGQNLEAASAIGKGIATNLLGQAKDKTFLRGFSNVADVWGDLADTSGARQGAATKFLTDIAAGFVPNLGKQAVRSLDDYERNYKQADYSHSFWPDGRDANPMVDVFGREQTKSGPKWLRLIWPTPLNIEGKPEATDELVRNWNLTHPTDQKGDNYHEHSRYFPERPARDTYVLKLDGKERAMTRHEMREFDLRAGKNFQQAQSSLTPERIKRASFEDIMQTQKNLRAAKDRAKGTMVDAIRKANPATTATAPVRRPFQEALEQSRK
jgi:hypothetical protein